ncbi:Crp/Fnr family transcriptional regulator [Microvenator marinus]|uniref:Crp/Fnr family transcriptional regulator n=1 Tax=Microvenator marinus TaxID=2600177 RepID=A0A5B8XLT8_9DELT|nr:Crp/Fnr family transcriptional regulator [Microvenator marinus]QED26091.1 Crp/Fnr family transcriptional regulator [Microvenator marinus]
MATKGKDSEKGVTSCAAGTVLFKEGETGTKMYVIKSGRIRMSKRVFDTDVTVEELGAGDFCGEIALLNEQPRPTTATVLADATVIQVDAAQFENMIRSNSDIAVRMLKKMSQRLIQSQFRLSNFALRTTKGRLLHQLRAESSVAGGKPSPIPDNLVDVLGLELGEIKVLLSEFVKDDLISIDKRGFFTITDPVAFDRYLKYLELNDHFEFRN